MCKSTINYDATGARFEFNTDNFEDYDAIKKINIHGEPLVLGTFYDMSTNGDSSKQLLESVAQVVIGCSCVDSLKLNICYYFNENAFRLHGISDKTKKERVMRIKRVIRKSERVFIFRNCGSVPCSPDDELISELGLKPLEQRE